MKYAIQINDSPLRSWSPQTGLQFIKAALASGHEVIRVFFYHEGIHNAFGTPESTETAKSDWVVLAETAGVELVFCVSAAERRGMVAPLAGFQPGGLGLWVDACLRADRIVIFGG